MFSALYLKLFRDLTRMKGQIVAVSLVMACGIAMMLTTRGLITSIEANRDAYYSNRRFADLFCELKRAPNSLRTRLAEIAGVAAVETRVAGRLTLDLPGLAEPADGSILSLPEDRPQQLNLLQLRRGRVPSSGSHNEVVLGEAFAKVHGLQPGHEIDATIHGARQRLKIVGIALSPEFVFEARAGETFPDSRRFGVFWMNERELASAYDLDGAFNSVLVDLAPGQDPAPVQAELDRILTPYGGRVAYGRRNHPSAVRLDDELKVMKGLSVAFPTVFLSIAAFMTGAVLSRLIRLQREQIAQLKALGYSSRHIGAHYLNFAFVIVISATAIGTCAGLFLGQGFVKIYQQFFQFPSLSFYSDWKTVGIAAMVSAGAACVGVFGSVRLAVNLPPAEAMRPEAPAKFRPTLLERMGLHRFVSPAFRMALRNLQRRPWQAAFTTLGLALATAIPVVPGAMRDGINHIMDFQWSLAQRQNATVALMEPGSASALHDLRHLPGVIDAQPFRSVPAQVRFGHQSRRLSITGLPRDATLNRLLDAAGTPVALPSEGLLVSAKLAEVLGAKPGDTMTLDVQEGHRPRLNTVLQGTIVDYAGIAAYMEIGALRRLLREGATISGAHLALDMNHYSEFLEQVEKSPRIASLSLTGAVRATFKKTTAEMIGKIQWLYFIFAIIVAFGVVYNSARIALSERSRDLATLRVVGFTQREVAWVMISELLLLTILALPMGLLIGKQLATGIVTSVSTETVRLPLILSSYSYTVAVIIVLVSSALSFAVVSRRIHNLDLLGVLKARD